MPVSNMVKVESSLNSSVDSAAANGSTVISQPVVLSNPDVSKSEVNSDPYPQNRSLVQLKSVEDIPAFDASGSTSSQNSYDRLVSIVRQYPCILGGVSSPEFTFEVQASLICLLLWTKQDDPSVLFRVVRDYYDTHRDSDMSVFARLQRFCEEHPEVIQSTLYAAGMLWNCNMRNELSELIWGVQASELREQKTWVKAKEFLSTIPFGLPVH